MLDTILASAPSAGITIVIVLLLASLAGWRRNGSRGPNQSRGRNSDQPGPTPATLSIDAAATNELHRARRYDRPLAVVSLTSTSAADARRIASELHLHARVNDIVGQVGRSAVAVLPEAEVAGAAGFARRVAAAAGADLANRTLVGIASFPLHEVTWVGLLSNAQAGAVTLAEFSTLQPSDAPDLGRDLDPARAASPFTGSNVTPVRVADPAA